MPNKQSPKHQHIVLYKAGFRSARAYFKHWATLVKQVDGKEIHEIVPCFTHKPAEAYGFRFAEHAHGTRGMLLIHPLAIHTDLTTLRFRRKAHTVLPAYPIPGLITEDTGPAWVSPASIAAAAQSGLNFSQRYGYASKAVGARQQGKSTLLDLMGQQLKVQQALIQGNAIHVKMLTDLNFSTLEGRIAGPQIIIDDPLNP